MKIYLLYDHINNKNIKEGTIWDIIYYLINRYGYDCGKYSKEKAFKNLSFCYSDSEIITDKIYTSEDKFYYEKRIYQKYLMILDKELSSDTWHQVVPPSEIKKFFKLFDYDKYEKEHPRKSFRYYKKPKPVTHNKLSNKYLKQLIYN